MTKERVVIGVGAKPGGGPDAGFAGMAGVGTDGHYVTLRYRGDTLEERKVWPAAALPELQRLYLGSKPVFRGEVQADNRIGDHRLMGASLGPHVQSVNVAAYRLEKTPADKSDILSLSSSADSMLRGGYRGGYRGALEGVEVAREHKRFRGFTQTRIGLRDANAHFVDRTLVEADASRTDWVARCARVYAGLAAVEASVREGARVVDMNDVLVRHLDLKRDVPYGNSVALAGFKDDIQTDVIGPNAVYRVQAVVKDARGGDAAVFYGTYGAVPSGATTAMTATTATTAMTAASPDGEPRFSYEVLMGLKHRKLDARDFCSADARSAFAQALGVTLAPIPSSDDIEGDPVDDLERMIQAIVDQYPDKAHAELKKTLEEAILKPYMNQPLFPSALRKKRKAPEPVLLGEPPNYMDDMSQLV